MDRRQLITGLISFIAAPAIVRASSLMPIKPLTGHWTEFGDYRFWYDAVWGIQLPGQVKIKLADGTQWMNWPPLPHGFF